MKLVEPRPTVHVQVVHVQVIHVQVIAAAARATKCGCNAPILPSDLLS